MVFMLHPGVRRRAEDLGREFASARPFRHVVVQEFFWKPIYAGGGTDENLSGQALR